MFENSCIQVKVGEANNTINTGRNNKRYKMGITGSLPIVGATDTTTPREYIASVLDEDKTTEIYNQLIIWLPTTAGVIISTYVVYKVISLCINRKR